MDRHKQQMNIQRSLIEKMWHRCVN